MDQVRFRTASLLGLAGLLHVAQFVCGLDAMTMITVLLGTAYLAIGTLMFNNIKSADYAGGVMSLAGLWVANAGVGRIPLILSIVLIALDMLVVAGCFYLVFKDRQIALRVTDHRPG